MDLNKLKLNSISYQRINECFRRFQTKFELLICWESNGKYCISLNLHHFLNLFFILDCDICTSSIASYFNKKGYECQECFPRSTISRKYNMTIPNGNDIALLDTWLSYFCLDIKM